MMQALLFGGVLILLAQMIEALPQTASPTSLDAQALASIASSAIASATAAGLLPYVPPRNPNFDQWISLGDSFSAGIGSNGPGDRISDSGSCRRFKQAFPMQMNPSTKHLTFGACSGDKMQDVIDKQLNDVPKEKKYAAFGKPELALLTISGNDLQFGSIIRVCILGISLGSSCDDLMNSAKQLLNSNAFAVKIMTTMLNIVAKGQGAGGANPPNSFQLFVNGYIQFWNEDDPVCDNTRWKVYSWTGQGRKLTTAFRKDMNGMVNSLNALLEQCAGHLKSLGVFYNAKYTGTYSTHRFCEKGSNPEDQSAAQVWFWSPQSPYINGPGPESTTANVTAQGDAFLEYLVPDASQRAQILAGADPGQFSPAFKSPSAFDAALDAMESDPRPEINVLPVGLARMFHPKGQPYGVQAVSNEVSIQDQRAIAPNTAHPAPNPAPPPPPPPSGSDICGDWYKVVDDDYDMRGKSFNPDLLGQNGEGLLDHLRHCGVVTDWFFEWLPKNDPSGFQWHSSGKLPIGTRSCIGSALEAVGGKTADGCVGAG